MVQASFESGWFRSTIWSSRGEADHTGRCHAFPGDAWSCSAPVGQSKSHPLASEKFARIAGWDADFWRIRLLGPAPILVSQSVPIIHGRLISGG